MQFITFGYKARADHLHLFNAYLVAKDFAIFGFPDSSVGKNHACKAGDLGSIPGLGRCPGEGKGYVLHYSGHENSTDCLVHGFRKESDTTERLSLLLFLQKNITYIFCAFCFQKQDHIIRNSLQSAFCTFSR